MSSKLLVHVQGNAVAYLALFVALTGTAIAADVLPRNSVGTAQIKKNAVTGKKVKKNTLTGRNIKESSLARVPRATNATKLDGKAASAFLAAGGTAANADRLDGIDSTVFGTTQTYAGMNFEPRDSAGGTAKTYQGPGGISCAGTATDFTTRAQLPQGARITGLDYRFVDNSALVSSNVSLVAYDTFEQSGAVTATIATAVSDGDDGSRRTSSSTPATTHIVNNDRYSYQLNWSPFACSAEIQIVGAAVRYTLPG